MREDKRCEGLKECIVETCAEVFKENLVGIYLHGSLAFGCFRWEKSDFDFLVVVKEEPALSEKMDFIKKLLATEAEGPPKGLEMSVVLEKDCRNFLHPTPYVLHYSKMHMQKCREDLKGFCRNMNGADKDLAAHFTVVRTVGITLWGKEISKVFAPVPEKDYLDSIRDDIENIAEEIADKPVYMILNACRVLAFIKEKAVLSKEQGGSWGLTHLPEKYEPLIEAALKDYQGVEAFRGEQRELADFSRYVQERLFERK